MTIRLKFIASLSGLAIAAMFHVAPAAAEELKIGAVGTLSGGGTEWGLAVQRGLQIAIDEVNAAGGLKIGGKTYNPRMIIYDDQYTAQGGTTAATRLVNVDDVKFIMGPVGSPPVLGVINVTNPAKVIVIANGYSPKILGPENLYNFRYQITTNEFAPAAARWMKTKYPNVKTVGIISPNDAVGQTVTPIEVAAYKEAGFDVTFDEKFERGMTDFSPLITRMIARGVDIFEVDSNAPGDAGLMVKQARQLGFKGVIIQTGGPGMEEVIKVAGPLANGFLSYDLFDPTDPAAEGYVKAYRAKYSGPIPQISVIVYNGTKHLLFEAMKKADSIDVEKVRTALEKQLDGSPSVFGPVRWGGEKRYGIRHQLMHDFYISEVQDGKIVTIARIKAEE